MTLFLGFRRHVIVCQAINDPAYLASAPSQYWMKLDLWCFSPLFIQLFLLISS